MEALPLLAGYAEAASPFDEILASDGSVRPHWRCFVAGFAGLGAEGRQAAAGSTQRLLRESGIAFNVYADPDDRQHAWRLDLVPALLPQAEWTRLARGLVQRARLIDATLSDLYGEQRLLRSGTLPPALVFGSPLFVRASVSHDRAKRPFLRAYACDIARTETGGWVVLGDQTDAVIGNGHVLASRVALSHGLAELFRECNTERLAGHYMAVQDSFQALSGRDDGRIVLLSPGPESPSYFSHAYLARYLGYTLAESGDLTVRDNLLYLKTLDGLQRVDLLLRKLPGHGMDPLQSSTYGGFGIPGLMQAVRSGRVTIVNRLGSGLVQNRALAAFMPTLIRRVLGEEPILADLPSLWLGEPAAREAVRAEPRRWALVEATARNDPGEPCLVLTADGADPAHARERAAAFGRDGHRWVAVEPARLASAPSLDGDRLVPSRFAIRAFVTATPTGWTVLPGGLVRLAGEPTAAVLPNGFGSKDLWITAAEPRSRPPASILRATMDEVHLRRTGRDLLSRTADNLFWLGRYAERAEATMRLLRSVLTRFLEDGRPDSDPTVLSALLELVLRKDPDGPTPEAAAGWDAVEAQVSTLMFDARAYGLRDSLDNVHRTGTLVRDQISHDAWRMLNALHIDARWRQPPRHGLAWPGLELLDDGIRVLNAFSGTEAENMTRNFAWRFLEMGRRIERAVQLVELLGALVPPAETPERDGNLRLLLELGDSFMTYRSRYLMTPLVTPVLDLLVLDESNPRGVAFQLKELDGHLGLLPGDGPHRSPGQRLLLKLLTTVRLAEVGELARRDPDGTMPGLAKLLNELATGLPELSDIIAGAYFAHAEAPVVTMALRRREEP